MFCFFVSLLLLFLGGGGDWGLLFMYHGSTWYDTAVGTVPCTLGSMLKYSITNLVFKLTPPGRRE